ncbi:(2Fe-2S)-binding protein [Thermosipho atlanticus]|uniref:2Fe-2S iron-sulfur cluster binding domain-containing protein n=1 Tax=Thermosipho atlanticus DSM 15807 TaxID=1123380 RepID=A0A1M5RUK9_9BACT|nr:(2Fe-2S)-binding protein [Thermosipho atlanticus]SHH29718.1 2Fe-2S iron-sulfur cluster binding domain-containing protein [Thermosipho atlanticus DSM 15807]
MSKRVVAHPILEEIPDTKELEFEFEGLKLKAINGDTIASALIANGIDIFGYSESGKPKGFFCAIGKCSSCLVIVNGIPNVRACITLVEDGMKIERQKGKGNPTW